MKRPDDGSSVAPPLDPSTSTSPRRPADGLELSAAAPYLVVLLALVAELVAVLALNDGVFMYSLDDAYIHLSLSEQLRELHYGINAGELAAPSSSILWPLLLAPFARASWHAFVPLALNVAALFTSVHLLRRLALRTPLGSSPAGRWIAAAVVLGLVACGNLVGLALSGMEHLLQVALALAVLAGLVDLLDAKTPRSAPWWFFAAAVLGPLVRYENLAVTGAAALVLLMHRRVRVALGVALPAALLVGAFSLVLVSQGLNPLPSSIMVKSGVAFGASHGSAGAALLQNARQSLDHGGGLLLIALTGLLLGLGVLERHRPARRGLALFGLLVALAHLAAGRYDSFGRYDIYATTVCATVALVLALRVAADRLSQPRLLALAAALALALVPFSLRNLEVTARTPLGANNIYLQQYQLHRIATEFLDADVAANDIGWLSYRNPHRVLDLWGLGSERARRLRMTGRRTWMAELVGGDPVPAALVYQEWFSGQFPPGWLAVGRLHMAGPLVAAAQRAVTVVATSRDRVPGVTEALQRYAATAPPGAMVELYTAPIKL